MRKILFCFIFLFVLSCSKDESLNINNSSNLLEMAYYEEITNEYHSGKTFTIINIRPFEKVVSSTEELNLLQITARTNHDDSIVLFEVYANKTGNDVLYNNVFDFRTARGTPYNSERIELQVLANDDKEFIANFTGRVKHYNQWVPEYIYIDISYGSIVFKY